MKNKKVYVVIAVLTVVICAFIAKSSVNVSVNVNDSKNLSGSFWAKVFSLNAKADPTPSQAPAQTPAQTPADTTAPAAPESPQNGSMPTETKEIIDKYTMLVDKYKKEKPAYKKKEFQALPEEHRKFSGPINAVLDIASGYMTTEDQAEELVRAAGSEDILWDMPIHNTEKGCALTNYDAVSWAKCEDNGDGTYKISFSLKEEVNAEPTPADTLVPKSNHGAVMQPIAFEDLNKEIANITGKVPGLAVNSFTLTYRDCSFECVYDPATDQVKSITHHVVIDIDADIKLFVANITGSARLLNEMFIYDITW